MPLVFQHGSEMLLSSRLHETPAVTAALVQDVMEMICRAHSHPGQASTLARIERLVAEQAWAEVALALIDLELPQWQLRRLVYDGGEWHCALSRRRELPDWLDEVVEASHPDLPAALLEALLEAQRIAQADRPAWGRPSVPTASADSAPCPTLCCDNFA